MPPPEKLKRKLLMPDSDGDGRTYRGHKKMTNSVYPDETAHNEPSHQDLHCLHRHLLWSEGLNPLLKRGLFSYRLYSYV